MGEICIHVCHFLVKEMVSGHNFVLSQFLKVLKKKGGGVGLDDGLCTIFEVVFPVVRY
jgi:hypothetical protein